MIRLYESGVFIKDGREIIKEEEGLKAGLNRNKAEKNTIAYDILRAHDMGEGKEEENTKGREKLQIRFDKLTSHDITFVGIIQTARASGLKEFPVPYVLTNCHNSHCAVG